QPWKGFITNVVRRTFRKPNGRFCLIPADILIMRATQVSIDWHSELSIYASELFLKTVGDEYGWIGGTDDSGKLRCVLSFTIIRKPMFRLARFRVETIPLGMPLSLEEEKAFLNSAVEFLRSKRVDMIIPPST